MQNQYLKTARPLGADRWTHRDVNVIERQMHFLDEGLKQSFQTADQLKGAMNR